MDLAVNDDMRNYFAMLEKSVDELYQVAKKARAKGLDASEEVEIPLALDVASRVEGLVGPKGVGEFIREEMKKG